jgi:ribosomal protein L32
MAGPDAIMKQEKEQPAGGWNRPLTPLPTTTYTPHEDLHWSFCYDDYCSIYLQSKQNNNYFPTAGSAGPTHQRHNELCNCRQGHHPELDAVIQAKRLNIRKACRAWQLGNRVCHDCGFLVNMEGHEARCDASRPAHSSPLDAQTTNTSAPAGEGNRNNDNGGNLPNDTEQASGDPGETTDIRHRLPVLLVPGLKGAEGVTVNLSVYQQATEEPETRRAGNVQCQDEEIARLETMVRDVQWQNHHRGYPRPQIWGRCSHGAQRLHRSTISLVGASAYRGGLISQMARDMLLGALVTTAGLWFIGITLAKCYVVFRV